MTSAQAAATAAHSLPAMRSARRAEGSVPDEANRAEGGVGDSAAAGVDARLACVARRFNCSVGRTDCWIVPMRRFAVCELLVVGRERRLLRRLLEWDNGSRAKRGEANDAPNASRPLQMQSACLPHHTPPHSSSARTAFPVANACSPMRSSCSSLLAAAGGRDSAAASCLLLSSRPLDSLSATRRRQR